VINYQHLNIDKAGLKLIMDLAVEGGILSKAVNIDIFSDTQFSSDSNATR
jgi:NitT/TauT family transport system substrate-binding protein